MVCHGGQTISAADPLQAKAQQVQGNFLQVPPNLNPPTPFDVADQAPTVWFTRVPLPPTPADPWSIWGYGLLHSNGKFYVPLGDHRGIDANSYLYEYDHTERTLRQVADLQSAAKGWKRGEFGFGKIHGRLNEGADGAIYFASYWGQWRKESEKYVGDRVFRYDVETGKLDDLGMPLEGWGYPSTHMAPHQGLLYAEAFLRKGSHQGDAKNDYVVRPYESYKDPYEVKFLAYDVAKQKVVFHGAHEGTRYGRDFFVDAEGNAYWNAEGGQLEKYDPRTNQVKMLEVKMPGEQIRRTIGPDDNGMLYGVTHDEHRLFRFDPKREKIETIAEVWADSPGMDVTADGKFVYYIPGGHGPSSGTPLIQVDTATGRQKVLAFLHASVQKDANFNLGGTYCVQVSDDGATVYVGFNGTEGKDNGAWGDLAVVAVEVPSSER